jgi:all-trans-8'-apo-beta-carotenal 15,15'-oxygenase
MPTLTGNLFRGRGEADHRLDVVEGAWPDDLDGAVFIVGPDKRRAKGHWFDAPGLLCRIDVRPDAYGRIPVRTRRVRTRVLRIREKVPFLFGKLAFVELSPFGVTNLANTNVEPLDDRLFLGYDAGRPVEVDPDTLAVLSPVGSNREWFQALPGLLEPMIAVAAHPAAAPDENALYFVNSTPVPGPGGPVAFIARWALDGPVERWPITGLAPFESIHDIKATRDHLVFTDLPFAVGPEAVGIGERTAPNDDVTHLSIVAKADLRRTPPGRPVPAVTVSIPMPTGHLSVDETETDGLLTVYLEHIPLADLMIKLEAGGAVHGDHPPIPPEYEGLVALGLQPGVVGRYRIDPATGEVVEQTLAWDDRFWGPILATRDRSTPAARADSRQLWFAGTGFDPALIPESWWTLYGDADLNCLIHPKDLPTDTRPAALARFDLDAMEIADRWTYEGGAFPSPPQFIPRRDARGPDDGYVLVMVHQEGDKELQLFDSARIGDGPIARTTARGFNPPLLLHSCWMPPPSGRRRPDYRVSLGADLWGSIRDLPRHLVAMVRTAKVAKDLYADR